MDMAVASLSQYALIDPVLNQVGLFSNQEPQSLYDRLVSEGAESPMAALRVGALIDIALRSPDGGRCNPGIGLTLSPRCHCVASGLPVSY
jgi:hypothetical protein